MAAEIPASGPVAPFPHPQSLTFTGEVWRTDSPWDDLDVRLSEALPAPAFTLSIDADGARLTAGSEAALADGRNLFSQIVMDSSGELPGMQIEDQPRSAWRGLTLDVARHLFPVSDVLALLDAMALHRLNVLHLHLADDQGWRFEVSGYPRLTEIGARRERTLEGPQTDDPSGWVFDDSPYEGFYTRDDLAQIVRHAQNRGITVVPGVELPGHVQAALAAYPNLGVDPEALMSVREVWSPSDAVLGVREESFRFVRDVLEELMRTFPSPFVHIGGADVPLHRWENTEDVARLMDERGLTRLSEVQAEFTRVAAECLREKGRRAVIWESAAHTHVPDGTVIMDRSPQGLAKSLATRGYQVVAAPENLVSLDVYQGSALSEPIATAGLISLRDIHGGVVPSALAKLPPQSLLGVHAMLWTPYITTRGQMQRMLFPRLAAIAEQAWGSPVESSYRDYEERLRTHLARLDTFGIVHHPLD